MRKIDKNRQDHFKQFIKLSAEEQLTWAISQGHALFSLLPKELRLTLKRLKTNGKKTKTTSSGNT